TAKWKLVGQGVMFAQLKLTPGRNADGGGAFVNPDQWDGYQPARERVYSMLANGGGGAALSNVVFLTGDLHSAWAADLTPDPNNPDVASGGYDAASGAGSRAVEFVATSITSPALEDFPRIPLSAAQVANPHVKYVELDRRGYLLLDIDADRVVGEWWYVDTVLQPSTGHVFGQAMQVRAGAPHMIAATRTEARPTPPPLAA
ncbi:MAG: hypothetical protein JWP36_522, partial [Paucimonas sp.]|nr:hypothetical protein [Paucimonas sp.]